MLDVAVTMYINRYDKVLTEYDQATLRSPSGPKSEYASNVIDLIQNDLKLEDDILICNGKLNVSKGTEGIRALIFSHVPYDLLSYRNFSKLDLLESHTGKLKSRRDWNTKYFPVPDSDMSFLPFSMELLPIFGDHVMFKPGPINYRKAMVAHLKAKHVNPLTSDGTLQMLIPQVPKQTIIAPAIKQYAAGARKV